MPSRREKENVKSDTLVRPLFDGPLDIVGDVHGEIDLLRSLIDELGYDEHGRHGDGRRLVFVGDLVDRGPDSPAVVRLVERLVGQRLAQCVLGNHDLNLLLGHEKYENGWLVADGSRAGDEVLADSPTREFVLDFFRSLPLALERSDLRVVHAFWDDASIELVRRAGDARILYEKHRSRIDEELAGREPLDQTDRDLVHQNENPVKLITSGPEKRARTSVSRGGIDRWEVRVKWWESVADTPLCVFGHYSKPAEEAHDFGGAFCVDYGAGQRSRERVEVGTAGPFTRSRLAALRMPERLVVFDDGDTLPECG
ncbi:MAG: metallophosphoesterase [Planctomycetaceae bacterium]